MDYRTTLSSEEIYARIKGEREFKADFGKILSESINFLTKDFGNQALICLILLISSIIPILPIFIMGGWYIYIHKRRQGALPTVSEIFTGFQHFAPLFILSLIQGLIYLLLFAFIFGGGYILLSSFIDIASMNEDVIGNIIVLAILVMFPFYYLIQTFFFFSTFFVLFSNMDASESISASFQLAKKHFLFTLGIVFVTGLIAGLGANCCYVGMIFTYPFAFIGYYIYFEEVFQLQKETDDNTDEILEHLI